MDEDHDSEGFQLRMYDMPCCSNPVRLNDLIYFWPQAFGCFSWTVQNPNIGELNADAISELEATAGCPLVPIKQHLYSANKRNSCHCWCPGAASRRCRHRVNAGRITAPLR